MKSLKDFLKESVLHSGKSNSAIEMNDLEVKLEIDVLNSVTLNSGIIHFFPRVKYGIDFYNPNIKSIDDNNKKRIKERL